MCCVLLSGLHHLSQRCKFVFNMMQTRKACSSWPAGILLWLLLSLLLPLLIPTTFFVCANGMSFQRSLSFLNSCQIWFWSCESGTSTAVLSSIWFDWCWYAFLVSMYMKKKCGFLKWFMCSPHCLVFFWHQGYEKKRVRQQASERKMRLKEPRNYSWVILVIKEFPCVLGILNLDSVFSQSWKVGVMQGK